MTALLPIITESAVIFPSMCPLITILLDSNAPLTEPLYLTTMSETKTMPFIRPATSTDPEDLKSPSICKVSPI